MSDLSKFAALTDVICELHYEGLSEELVGYAFEALRGQVPEQDQHPAVAVILIFAASSLIGVQMSTMKSKDAKKYLYGAMAVFRQFAEEAKENMSLENDE